MKIYGLTGGIASGKSTVSTILKTEFKIPVIDADLLARKAVEPGSIGLKKILENFGEDILSPEKDLDRKKLGDRVFGNEKSIKTLNKIIHPQVDRMYEEWVEKYKKKGCKAIIYDCPLLVEENLIDRVDEIIVVITSESLQIKRLMSRNSLTSEEALQRIDMQIKMEEKISHANYIIYNDGSYCELKRAVIHLWTLCGMQGF